MHLQFHHSSYRPGSPCPASQHAPDTFSQTTSSASGRASPPSQPIPSEVDVLIIGAGPAGLLLAAQLAQFGDVTTALAERKSGPLRVGQADGVQCRSVEIFEAFGFAERVLREAYWVNETCFWRPREEDGADTDNDRLGGPATGGGGDGGGTKGGIMRSGRIRDVEEGLSEFPHVILNQARIHDFWLDTMAKGARPLFPTYSKRLADLRVDREAEARGEKCPVTAVLEHVNDGENDLASGTNGHTPRTQTVRAQYVVGCDGARSAVRQRLGLKLEGESANSAWGVMDILCVTTFPDIRFKCVIHSPSGNIVIIPREGGYLVRLYIEMRKIDMGQRASDLGIGKEDLIKTAQAIFQPYVMDVKEVVWWSVYEVGQRLCNGFDDASEGLGPRVFIMGDACHTHSPKAGQGMNVSMQDGYNLGWKLGMVLRGLAKEDLLKTYSQERQPVAKRLIDFDKELAKMYNAKAKMEKRKALKKSGQEHEEIADEESVDPAAFQRYFTQSGRYTAGMGTAYRETCITAISKAQPYQHLATGCPLGERFHSYPVVRFFDSKPIQLGHTIRADGRWRLIIFNDKSLPFDDHSSQPTQKGRLSQLCDYLQHSPESPIRRYYAHIQADLDSQGSVAVNEHTMNGYNPEVDISTDAIDTIIEVLAVFQQSHADLQQTMMAKNLALPEMLTPRKGKFGLTNMHNVFCDEKPQYNIWGATTAWESIYSAREVSRDEGAIIVVRPDGYVAGVFPLDLQGGRHEQLETFFAGFMKRRN